MLFVNQVWKYEVHYQWNRYIVGIWYLFIRC